MAILRMSSEFAEAANELPKEIRAKLTKIYSLLTRDPRHPSLQVKKIEGAKRSDVYECRVDQSWRLILRDAGNMNYDLVYIGAHDKTILAGQFLGILGGAIAVGLAGAAFGTPITVQLGAWMEGDDLALTFVDVDSNLLLN